MAEAPVSLRLSYLVTRLPALSHSFILREVLGLRARGVSTAIASINAPDRPASALTQEERSIADETLYVKQVGLAAMLSAHVGSALTRPRQYARGLAAAVRLAGSDLADQPRFLFAFTESLVVARFARKHRVGHVHVHFASSSARVALIGQRMGGFTFSITLHGPDDFSDARANRLAEIVHGARFVICISEFARSQAMLHSDPADWSKIEVVRLGVDLARFAGTAAERTPPFTLLSVGRLASAKGQHVLLSAIARLVAEGRELRLRLVGAGPLESMLRAHARQVGIEQCVEFAGGVNQDCIREFYRSADCFCLSSFAEGLPVVLMEAMAMGIPCIATQIAGIPELVENGATGLLVPAGDSRSLARAIARLMDDEALRSRLAAAGHARVAAEYDLAQNVDRLVDVIERRLSERIA